MAIEIYPSRRTVIAGALQAVAAVSLSHRSSAAEPLPKMTVTRDPDCGCCSNWVAHAKAAGFSVEVVEAADVMPLKTRLGVPEALMSCHTTEVDGYIVEGHVPAEAIKRLLVEHRRRLASQSRACPSARLEWRYPGSRLKFMRSSSFLPAGRTHSRAIAGCSRSERASGARSAGRSGRSGRVAKISRTLSAAPRLLVRSWRGSGTAVRQAEGQANLQLAAATRDFSGAPAGDRR